MTDAAPTPSATRTERPVPPIEGEARPLAAAGWMVGAIASFSTMALAGRAAALELDTFEIMLYRSLAGVLIVLAGAALARRLAEIRSDRLGLHCLRNLAHFTGQNLWFYALTAIPLAQVFALEFTSPVWVILLSAPLLGERLTRAKLLAAALGFAGILIVARPDPRAIDPGQLAALGAALSFALTAIATRRLTRTDSVVSILFWLTVMQAALGLLAAGVDGDIAVPGTATLPWVLLIATCGLTAHFCLTSALRLAPASTVMPMDFARLPVIAIVGVVVYGEPLETLVFVGAALIFLANWINTRVGVRR